MIRSEKKLTELGKILDSGKHTDIEAAIKALRDEEPYSGAILLLASFYEKNKDEGLRSITKSFFNDIKEKTATGEVIEALTSQLSQDTTAMIAASCWQSGLDYSGYAITIAEVYLKNDFMTSIECFTILDTCSASITEEDKRKIVSLLQDELSKQEASKQRLTSELISIFKD